MAKRAFIQKKRLVPKKKKTNSSALLYFYAYVRFEMIIKQNDVAILYAYWSRLEPGIRADLVISLHVFTVKLTGILLIIISSAAGVLTIIIFLLEVIGIGCECGFPTYTTRISYCII